MPQQHDKISDSWNDADLENWFTHHPPRDDQQVIDYQKIRISGRDMAAVVMGRCPEGRERDISIEKIREAVMWANAGIACGEPT